VPDIEFPRLVARVQLSDGRVLEARILNTDYLRWDRTRAKHGWPAASEAHNFAATFYAWSALRREGEIAESVTWEEFSDRMCEYVVVDREAGANGVGPTLEAPGPA
jgi:hypothetical protein